MRVLYGIEIKDTEDEYVRIAEEVLNSAAEAGNPGSFFVDTLPLCESSSGLFVVKNNDTEPIP